MFHIVRCMRWSIIFLLTFIFYSRIISITYRLSLLCDMCVHCHHHHYQYCYFYYYSYFYYYLLLLLLFYYHHYLYRHNIITFAPLTIRHVIECVHMIGGTKHSLGGHHHLCQLADDDIAGGFLCPCDCVHHTAIWFAKTGVLTRSCRNLTNL